MNLQTTAEFLGENYERFCKEYSDLLRSNVPEAYFARRQLLKAAPHCFCFIPASLLASCLYHTLILALFAAAWWTALRSYEFQSNETIHSIVWAPEIDDGSIQSKPPCLSPSQIDTHLWVFRIKVSISNSRLSTYLKCSLLTQTSRQLFLISYWGIRVA